MIIEWTDPALDDMEGIRDFIGKDSPFYARQFLERIFDYVENLAEQPKLGRIVPEEQREDVRELIYRDYRIIYLLHDDRIKIATVMRASRDFSNLTDKPWNKP